MRKMNPHEYVIHIPINQLRGRRQGKTLHSEDTRVRLKDILLLTTDIQISLISPKKIF